MEVILTDEDKERRKDVERRLIRIESLNKFRTSGVGVALFYGYLVAILLATSLAASALIKNSHTANDAHRGLCALKMERQARVDRAEAFLNKPYTPEAKRVIKAIGYEVLKRSLAQSKADLYALKDVDC